MVASRLPKDIVAKLNVELVRILNLPEIRERILADGSEPVGSTPAQFATQIRTEIARWTQVVKAAGIRAD